MSKRAKQAENLRKLLLADFRRRPRAAGQACRPATQHAHAGVGAAGKTRAHRRGDDGDLCAAGRPHGHAGHARGTGGAVVQAHQRRGLSDRHPAAGGTVRQKPRPDPQDRDRTGGAVRGARIEGDGDRPPKKPYSVFRKMQSKSLSFEQLSDIYGFRIIVDSIADCYRALGIVHTRWSVVPGRFKDYISTPKQNDYQSIHTTIIGPSRQRVETADPHRPHARDRGIRCCRPCDLQGRQHRKAQPAARFQRLFLAAADHRTAVGRRQSGRVPRTHQARAVPRPGLSASRPRAS